MTEFEEKLVIENLDLVDKVICTRITWRASSVLMTYEDLQAVGREALCRAAMHYNPRSGPFAPFARKCIYNAVIDHCRSENTVRRMTGGSGDDENGLDLLDKAGAKDSGSRLADALAAKRLLSRYEKQYTGISKLGVEALELKLLGFSSSEIAKKYGTNVNNVNAWISRARQKLQREEEIQELMGETVVIGDRRPYLEAEESTGG